MAGHSEAASIVETISDPVGQEANGFAGPTDLRSIGARTQRMCLEDARLVRRLQLRLNSGRSNGRHDVSLSACVAELNERVCRLHRLGRDYAAVRVSRHVSGLRAVSVPDRAEGVSSPGT